jgi:hypothetical protein
MNIHAIKDALDIISKLTIAEPESLKTMLLRSAFVKLRKNVWEWNDNGRLLVD